MRFGRNFLIVILGAGWFVPSVRAADCEPNPEIRQVLQQLQVTDLVSPKLTEQQKALLQKAMADRPSDVFLHLRYQRMAAETDAGRGALAERYQTLADQHAGDPEYTVLLANTWVDVDTPKAIALLKQAAPSYPLAHLLLADIFSWGKFADHPEMRRRLESFYEGCPASLNDEARDLLEHNATPDMAAKYGPQLRARLMKDTDPEDLAAWRTVWDLEFKASPPAEHDGIRKQVAADLARLQNGPQPKDLAWLTTLEAGYKMVGDESARRSVEDQIVAEYPASYDASAIVRNRWSKQHPEPKAEDSKENKQAYYRAEWQEAETLLKVQPDNFGAMTLRLDGLENLEDSDPEQVVAAGEGVRRALLNHEGWFVVPPFEFQIARAYLKKKAHVADIPALIDAGWATYRTAMTHPSSDREPDDVKQGPNETALYMTTEAADILVGAAAQLKNPEIARSAVEALAAPKADTPDTQSAQWAVKAKWAELTGRKLDALLMYRAALDVRPSNPDSKAGDDEAGAGYARLWKELGGTSEGEKLWARNENRTEGSAMDGSWKNPAKELPPWQLPDLAGKTWTLASLKGKTVLINVWATWCAPCRQEHPYLQKLLAKVQGRSDVQILTFNVDDELGNISPYMKENRYTFPVLLAKDYVNDLLPLIAIPRNWVVDANGKWQWEQVGMGPPQRWEETVLEKLGGK
jgi:thiol-disulfide isomerase/thioredoxin